MSEQTNSGAGNQEPDPATAENPPRDISAGDAARDPEGSASHRADRMETGVGGKEPNADPSMPAMDAGDQGG